MSSILPEEVVFTIASGSNLGPTLSKLVVPDAIIDTLTIDSLNSFAVANTTNELSINTSVLRLCDNVQFISITSIQTTDATPATIYTIVPPTSSIGPNYSILVCMNILALRTDDTTAAASAVGVVIRKEYALTWFNNSANVTQLSALINPSTTAVEATLSGFDIIVQGVASQTYLIGGFVTLSYVN